MIEADTAAQNMSLQQNEILYRGMSSLGEEFLLMALAYCIPVKAIASLLAGLAEESSIWASQQSGARSASFGVSLPAMLSGALAESASRSYGQNTGTAESSGQAHTAGQAQSEGTAHTVGQAASQGWSHSVSSGSGTSTGSAVSNGTGTSEGTSHADSVSHTEGSFSSKSHSTSVGGGGSTSASEGWSAGVSANGKEIPLIGGIVEALGFGGVKVNAGYNEGTPRAA